MKDSGHRPTGFRAKDGERLFLFALTCALENMGTLPIQVNGKYTDQDINEVLGSLSEQMTVQETASGSPLTNASQLTPEVRSTIEQKIDNERERRQSTDT